MTNPDSLFQLIKSMSKAEKRHFKLSMAGYQPRGGKNYLRLFDAIDAQTVYNENVIRKKFKNETYFRHLRSIKLYLQGQILKGLRSFHDDSSSKIKLNNYLTDIEILYKRQMFEECQNMIKKAKALAQKYDNLPRQLELTSWESKIPITIADAAEVEARKRDNIDEEKKILVKYDELTEIRRLDNEILFRFNRGGGAKTNEEKEFLESILSDKSFQTEMQSFHAEIIRLISIAHSITSLEKFDGATAMLSKAVQLFESNPHQIEESINLYFSILLDLISGLTWLKQYSPAAMWLRKADILYEKKYNELDLRNRIGYLHIETSLLLRQGEFARALDFVPDIIRLLETHGSRLDPSIELSLSYQCFDIYFRNGDFKNAQNYIQKIINYGSSTRVDIQATARVVYLILQLELKEYEHIGYLLRSTYRYLIKKQRLHKTESLILQFLREALKFNSEARLLTGLNEFKKMILSYDQDDFFISFPLIEWIDSKLQKRPLVEIVKEKYLAAVTKEETGIEN